MMEVRGPLKRLRPLKNRGHMIFQFPIIFGNQAPSCHLIYQVTRPLVQDKGNWKMRDTYPQSSLRKIFFPIPNPPDCDFRV